MVREIDENLGPSNPFIEETSPKDPVVDVIMQSVQEVTSRKNASFYVIANSRYVSYILFGFLSFEILIKLP